jgi:uncharacterized protein (DUF1330 family)
MRGFLIAAAIVGASILAAGAQPAKKGYVLAELDVTGRQQYAEYMKLEPAIIEKFGGRFVVNGGRHATVEGSPARGRIAVIEFPSLERAEEFYKSAEYDVARKLREGAATVRFVLVEGI